MKINFTTRSLACAYAQNRKASNLPVKVVDKGQQAKENGQSRYGVCLKG